MAEFTVTPGATRPTAKGLALAVLSAAATLVILREGREIFAPVLVSVLLGYVLEPAVSLLMRVRIPRLLAALLVYAGLGLAAWTVSVTATGPVIAFATNVSRTIVSLRSQQRQPAAVQETKPSSPLKAIEKAVRDVESAFQPRPRADSDVVRVETVKPARSIGDYLAGASATAADVGLRLSVVAILTFLIVATGDLYKRKLLRIAGPTLSDKKLTLEVIRAIDRQIERYLVVRLLISGIVAAATAVGLLAIGLSDAIVWAIIAGILNVLPFIGPTVACLLIALAGFVQFQSIEMAAAAGGIGTFVAALEGNWLTPLMTSRAGELNTVAVFVSVLFWGWVWGVWGLVLAVPLMVAVKAAADRIEPLQPLGELLGM